MNCPRCNIQMVQGVAIIPTTWKSSDGFGATCSDGTGELGDCLKCPVCGYSVTMNQAANEEFKESRGRSVSVRQDGGGCCLKCRATIRPEDINLHVCGIEGPMTSAEPASVIACSVLQEGPEPVPPLRCRCCCQVKPVVSILPMQDFHLCQDCIKIIDRRIQETNCST